MVDRLLPLRLQREAVIRKGEKRVERAALAVMQQAGNLALKAFNPETGFLDEAVLDERDLDLTGLTDTIGSVFAAAYEESADKAATQITAVTAATPDVVTGIITPEQAALAFLGTKPNKLVGVGPMVWGWVRDAIAEGAANGDSIPHIAAAVDKMMRDMPGVQMWKNRAVTIARTETIAAFNAGNRRGTFEAASAFGISDLEVVRQWVATFDSSTRESHAEADGQQVVGEGSYYDVGGSVLIGPGDPAGPPEEVINCRCTEVFLMPGDPDYPSELPEPTTPWQANYTTDPGVGTTLADQSHAMWSAYNNLDPIGDEWEAWQGWNNYCHAASTLMNNILRTGSMGKYAALFDRARVEQFIDELRALFANASHVKYTDSAWTLFRGAGPKWVQGKQVGDILTDKGFTSLTSSTVVSDDFLATASQGWRIIVHVPKGTPYLPGIAHEFEAILGAGTRFKVLHLDKVQRMMEVEALP